METIYLIQVEWKWFDEKEIKHDVIYAVKDEITAREDCKKLQIKFNESKNNCYGEKRYYYEEIDLFTF